MFFFFVFLSCFCCLGLFLNCCLLVCLSFRFHFVLFFDGLFVVWFCWWELVHFVLGVCAYFGCFCLRLVCLKNCRKHIVVELFLQLFCS